MSQHPADVWRDSPSLPNTPEGYFWRHLSPDDRRMLTAHWQILNRYGERTLLWKGWFGTLVDCTEGGFAAPYLRVMGLFCADHELVAMAAETESLANPRASEIAFVVAPAWQGQRLGKLALHAALLLAQQRKSDMAFVEFHPDNQPCMALCQAEGMHLQMDRQHSFMRAIIPLKWPQRIPVLWRQLRWRYRRDVGDQPFQAMDRQDCHE